MSQLKQCIFVSKYLYENLKDMDFKLTPCILDDYDFSKSNSKYFIDNQTDFEYTVRNRDGNFGVLNVLNEFHKGYQLSNEITEIIENIDFNALNIVHPSRIYILKNLNNEDNQWLFINYKFTIIEKSNIFGFFKSNLITCAMSFGKIRYIGNTQ